MGDRANVYMVEDEAEQRGVYLYTHWGGYELPALVANVLARKQRWDDSPYLARMIFSAMIKGEETGETGFGISASLCDNEHPIVVVDCAKREVRFEDEPSERSGRGRVLARYTFAEYAARGSTATYPSADEAVDV